MDPLLPSIDLANWALDLTLEPCPRCGGGHLDRTKFVCSSCDHLYCVSRTRVSARGNRWHRVSYRFQPGDKTSGTWCGPLDACGDWPCVVPILQEIVNDLDD